MNAPPSPHLKRARKVHHVDQFKGMEEHGVTVVTTQIDLQKDKGDDGWARGSFAMFRKTVSSLTQSNFIEAMNYRTANIRCNELIKQLPPC